MMNNLTKYNLLEADMLAFASHLACIIPPGTIIFLYGPLGAGKTTFARSFLRGLGYEGKVKSPTYTLVESYEMMEKIIYHFDFYRLSDPTELNHIGIQEYFSKDSICLIEWPEKGFPLLPKPDLACYISFAEKGREIYLEAESEQGKEILSRL